MNTHMKPQATQTKSSASVKDRVFTVIDEHNVEPRSKYVFHCQNGLVWSVWLATVLLGALATAILLFTSSYRYYDMYEAMHDNFVTFFVQALPVLWVLAFIVLMYVAMRGLRATRRGYKLSPMWIAGSSVGVSLVLGFLANMSGFGFVVDKFFGEYAPMYYSQAEREAKLWQQPAEGRLLGRQVGTKQTDMIVFIDTTGTSWQIDVLELHTRDRALLAAQQQVRVLGQQMNKADKLFHACGVFPWMMDKQHSIADLSKERKEFVDKIYGHMNTANKRLEQFESAAFGAADPNGEPSMAKCAEIAAVRRMSAAME